MRLEEVQGRRRTEGDRFTFFWNGEPIDAWPGETILGALMAAGHATLRYTRFAREPRGMFCGIGACYDCLVHIDGKPNRRACVMQAKPGMRVESGGLFDIREAE